MESSEKVTARIGMVNYLNTAPIHEKWKESVSNEAWQLVEAPPSELNRKLAEGTIDLGFVSSFEYGLHPDKYKMLSGLSISANGSVGSVFLFSHIPMEQLDGKQVLLTSQSDTSVQLVKILLEEFTQIQPVYFSGDVFGTSEEEFKAVLAIGDDALRLVEGGTYLYQYDLGDMWKRQTGLPFVFAVCAVREEFCNSYPETLDQIHQEMLRCKNEGKEDLDNICEIAAGRIPISKSKCHAYLDAIEYDLGTQKRQALEIFFEILVKRGDVPPDSLPLKIYAKLGG